MRTSKTIKQAQEDHAKKLRKMTPEERFERLIQIRQFTKFLSTDKINKGKSLLYNNGKLSE